MNKLFLFVYLAICLVLTLYVSVGVYFIIPLLFQDMILIGQNIASLFALISYVFLGINLLKNRYNGIAFSLSLTAFVLAISIAEQSRTFLLEMIKQLGLPFIMTLIIFWNHKSNISGDIILKEATLAAVLWLGLRLLRFENIYNILISLALFGMAYYLLEMIHPLSEEAKHES
ncbi:MAG: hypothetical protein AMQ22_00253 [Candidatus Methanofastidiosum methylothiophilum]|uniref:Uncharacterized protein n=1 Tax=Candidatus Methanofastidiosum methylothiophilum TaxID=1705564 RepID=A0A150J884_9EURY|nr:MAG: hypothetical protein AMQ22_00253 [Candidatus Methanofastidiosum methylthiophilus]